SPAVVKRLEDLKTAGKKDLADKLSQEIREAWETAFRYKKGHVIVGQVKLADGKKDVRLVDAQMVILEEGLFAGEVRDLERPVGFALQGYLPAELQLKGKNGNIVDVGEIILQPLTQEKSSSLKAKISTESGSASEVSMKLAVSRGAINTPHNGYSPRGAPGWEAPTELRPDNEGRVAGSNLSPGKYSVTVSAPGHINQSRAIDLQPGQLFDLGEIRLLEELSGEKKPVDFSATALHWKKQKKRQSPSL
ncbi:MAG: carboxypeptidase regulatory-like domain-containing protein, partial [Verrucomicrobia bacterium]|nr:carboxypeptidase regulatory-like domain-containing protein [Verrucomicrobiota bacterium]